MFFSNLCQLKIISIKKFMMNEFPFLIMSTFKDGLRVDKVIKNSICTYIINSFYHIEEKIP